MKTILFVLLLFATGFLWAASVADSADIFTKQEEALLEEQLSVFRKNNNVHIYFYTCPDLKGQTIEELGYTMFNELGIGKKGLNNGVGIFIAPKERKLRIEVGFGMEWSLSNVAAKVVVDSMISYFKKRAFHIAAKRGIELIDERIHSSEWQVVTKSLSRILKEDEGKIIAFSYTCDNPKRAYKIPSDPDQQFDEEFRFRLFENEKWILNYSFSMDDLIRQIRSGETLVVYARLKDFETGEFQLLGIRDLYKE